jgi:signal peptidase I
MSQFPPRSESLRRKRKIKSREWIHAVLFAIILSVVVRLFVFEPFNVSGPSMEDTMHTGDLVLVNKLIYKIREPRRGEVIVFHATEKKDYIKRVIALPGETVEAKNNQILINGQIIQEPYISEDIRTMDFKQWTVPPGEVFVLGDNRLDSRDSREFGPIKTSQIVGRAELIYWPLDEFKFLW